MDKRGASQWENEWGDEDDLGRSGEIGSLAE